MNHRLSLDPGFEKLLISGDFCPAFDQETILFALISDEYSNGQIEREFEIRVESGGVTASSFDFSYDWNLALKQFETEGFRLPSISIGKISMYGEVEIDFSDTFVVP